MQSLWTLVRLEAFERAACEPALRSYLDDTILRWHDGPAALVHRLALQLAGPAMSLEMLQSVMARAFVADDRLGAAAAMDLRAAVERDPACHGFHVPFLFYKGFHALQIHRAAHWYWHAGLQTTAYLLQHRCNEALAVDIHPATRIGHGVLLDHATGFVAGETAIIEDNVNLLHGVTLGGTGKVAGDRHPKVRCGASIGAGAKILGNIEVGAGAKVGAGAVVLEAVPSTRTAVGIRARLLDRLDAVSGAGPKHAAVLLHDDNAAAVC